MTPLPTPQRYYIKGHSWSVVEYPLDPSGRLLFTVYEHEVGGHPERYFCTYSLPGEQVVQLRGVSRETLIRSLADSVHAGSVVLPGRCDPDDALDQCEILLFGKVVSR